MTIPLMNNIGIRIPYYGSIVIPNDSNNSVSGPNKIKAHPNISKLGIITFIYSALSKNFPTTNPVRKYANVGIP